MKLTRWDPFQDTGDLIQRFNQMLGSPGTETSGALATKWRPVANITENDKEYLIKAELPEVKREDIEIEVHDDVLSIRGERKVENERKDDTVHRVESFYGSFARSFRLPEDVDTGAIRAEARDGVLHVHLPKTKPSKPRSVKVDVK